MILLCTREDASVHSGQYPIVSDLTIIYIRDILKCTRSILQLLLHGTCTLEVLVSYTWKIVEYTLLLIIMMHGELARIGHILTFIYLCIYVPTEF